MNNSIKETILKNRPKLSESSVRTYVSILKNLYKSVFPDDKDIDITKFDDDVKILDHLKTLESSKRKTVLSALFVISKNEKFQELMQSDGKQYNDDQNKQEATETQKENWVSQEDIKQVIDKYAKFVKSISTKETLTTKEFQFYQDYIILCLMSGLYIPPRRLKDWTEMKIKNAGESDNMIECTSGKKKRQTFEFVFRTYKTAKYYGAQKVDIPKELNIILQAFLKHCPTDYLLCDSHNSKLTPVKLNQRLNKMFGKKVSCNMLRHSFLTEKYKDIPALNQLKEIASDMGHSVMEGLQYVKKDAPIEKPQVEPVKIEPAKVETKFKSVLSHDDSDTRNEIDAIKNLAIVSKAKRTKK